MTRTFLPQADAIPMGGEMYRPAYRWYREDNMRFVPGSVAMRGRTAAREAAEDFLASGLNKQRGGPVEPEADILGIEDWKQRKAGDAAAERERVFGSAPAFARNQSGRLAPVEYRNRRRA